MGASGEGFSGISMRERAERFLYGIVFFSAGIWLWAFVIVNGFPLAFRLYAFVPFYAGFLGIGQGLRGFCLHRYGRYEKRMRGKPLWKRRVRRHRRTALLLHAASIGCAAVATAAFMLAEV